MRKKMKKIAKYAIVVSEGVLMATCIYAFLVKSMIRPNSDANKHDGYMH